MKKREITKKEEAEILLKKIFEETKKTIIQEFKKKNKKMNREELEKEMYKLTGELWELCLRAKSEMLLDKHDCGEIFKKICEIERIIVIPF